MNIHYTRNRVLGTHDKVKYLVEDEGAVILNTPPSSMGALKENESVIVVVHNELYDKACVCCDSKDIKLFSDTNDGRKKTWLLINTANLKNLIGQ